MNPSLAFVNTEEKLLKIAAMAGFTVGAVVTSPEGMIYLVDEIKLIGSDYARATIRLKAVGQPKLPFRIVDIRLPIVSWETQSYPTLDWGAEAPFTAEDSPVDRKYD